MLLGTQAQKAVILQELQRPHKIVHFATHGFVNEKNYDLSALACFNTDEEGEYIYANDYKNLNLTADLVVLSSCESGIGREADGEGLLSLNRAFIAAGANNVMSTLWKIDDRFSSDIMIRFHQQISKVGGYATPLQVAKTSFLSNPSTAAPRYWAPFVLFGE